jgi:hypothetical protein
VSKVKRAGVRTSKLSRRISETFEEYMSAEHTVHEFFESEMFHSPNSVQRITSNTEKGFHQSKYGSEDNVIKNSNFKVKIVKYFE